LARPERAATRAITCHIFQLRRFCHFSRVSTRAMADSDSRRRAKENPSTSRSGEFFSPVGVENGALMAVSLQK
jgi:hypothetical protein